MVAQYTERNEDVANDVTAVTSKNENRFAQRRADALTTMAETDTGGISEIFTTQQSREFSQSANPASLKPNI